MGGMVISLAQGSCARRRNRIYRAGKLGRVNGIARVEGS